MNIPDGLLMRTPAYSPLESPLHYILRLSEANGYSTPTVVMSLAAPDEDWRVLAKWNCTYINRLLPDSQHTPPTFTYRWPSSSRRCDLALLGKPMLSRHINARHAGICPECVHDLGFAPAWCDTRFAIACPTHNRMLIFRCQACGKRLSLYRRGLCTCSCGASLSADTNQRPSTELIWLMALLRQKVEAQHEGTIATEDVERPLKPEDVELGTLCRIIEIIAKAEHRLSGGNGSWLLDVQHRCLPLVAAFLYRWPSGVDPFCSRWLKGMEPHSDGVPTLRSAFAWAFQKLLHCRGARRHETLFVVDAVLQYASSELPGRAIDVRARDLRQLSQEGRAYCGVKRAAEMSGVPRHTIVRLVRRGRVPHRVAYRGTRAIYEIKNEVAHELRIEYRPALFHRQASKHLGVTHNLFRDLRHSGVLKKVQETMMPKAIAVCDLDDFKCKIFRNVQHTTMSTGLFSLDRLRLMKCPRPAMLKIVERLLNGSVQCFYVKSRPQRINDLLVRGADVMPMIREFSPRPPPTIEQFRSRYELSCHEAHALARYLGGVPASDAKIPPGTVDERKLETFLARYCGLNAYARDRGIGYWTALSGLRASSAKLLKLPAAKRARRFVYFVPRTHAKRRRLYPSRGRKVANA